MIRTILISCPIDGFVAKLTECERRLSEAPVVDGAEAARQIRRSLIEAERRARLERGVR